METQIVNATEYRNVTLALLSESKTNPRRTFEEVALKELASSIRTQGVLSPLLVRPLTENGFEIIAGARRYRAAQMAEVPTVPVRIVHLSDAAALEAQLVENLVRSEIHPMEEAQGLRFILHLVVGWVYKLVCGFSVLAVKRRVGFGYLVEVGSGVVVAMWF
jgi:ParB family chromosome partitioning protein